jgi:hypothetical protein
LTPPLWLVKSCLDHKHLHIPHISTVHLLYIT